MAKFPILHLVATAILSIALLSLSQCKTSEKPAVTPAPLPYQWSSKPTFSGENAWLHAAQLCQFGPRPAGSPALEQSRQYLTQQLQQAGWQVTPQPFTNSTPLGNIAFCNLIAKFPINGKTQPTQGILACHIDSKLFRNSTFVGANDGASHTGVLLEMARILALNPSLAGQIELVFFDGEEAFGPNIILGKDGLYGSIFYSKTLRSAPPESKPKFAIVADMVGHRDLLVQIPHNTPKWIAQAFHQAVQSLPDESDRQKFGILAGDVIDDHVPLNSAGIPSTDLIQGNFNNSTWWHTPQDDLSLLSPHSLYLSGSVIHSMLLHLTNSPQP